VNINLLEIRNYLLKPDKLESFISYFEEHFIFPQEDLKMQVLGQFRVIGEPDHFVWLRGFSDMQTRLEGLQKFYGGAVWEQYGPAANDMMLEWHNVHLLRPISNITDLTYGLSAALVTAELTDASANTGVIAIDFYQALSGKRDTLIDQFQTSVQPVYQREGIQLRGYFVAEMSENTFPRLPVIQNQDEFVVITAFESEEACRDQRAKLTQAVNESIGALLITPPEVLLLIPTLRSPLRYLPKPFAETFAP